MEESIINASLDPNTISLSFLEKIALTMHQKGIRKINYKLREPLFEKLKQEIENMTWVAHASTAAYEQDKHEESIQLVIVGMRFIIQRWK